MANFSSLKSILFDLGGVILDLNVNATLEGFYEMGFPRELLNYPENFNTDLFHKYETGKLSTDEFRNRIREMSGVFFEDQEFDQIWCAMLADVPASRVHLLRKLATRYNLYLLSNTSDLHIRVFERMFMEASGTVIRDVFKKTYYSFETGYHKPDPEAFRFVLSDAKITAAETLFLDDNIHNIKAAQELGFNALHISKYLKLEEIGFDL
jgi:putative hydrolase of the HAD superfamily